MADNIGLSGWQGFAAEEVDFLVELERFAARELTGTPSFTTWNRPLLERCAQLGLQSLLIDEGHVFNESRLPLAVASSEVLASWEPALGLTVGASRIHSLVLAQYASDALRDRWLSQVLAGSAIGSMAISESEAGSDVRAIRTVAHRQPGGWTLTGEKVWVSLGPVADFTIVLAKLEESRRDSDMGVFVVERGQEGVSYARSEVLDIYPGVPVGSLLLQNAFVADSYVVSAPGGFASIMNALNYARLEAACVGVGIQRGALRLAAEHARDRRAFQVPIEQHQAIQITLGRMTVNLEASRALLYRTAAAGFGSIDPAQYSCLKAFATDAAMAATTAMVNVLGASGLLAGSAAMELFKGAKAAQIYDGTSDINLMQVGRATSRRVRL